MITILLLTIAGVVISLVIGTLWHSLGSPMGRLHMRYIGFDKLSPEEQQQKIREAGPTMWKTYLGQMALSLLTSFAVVFIVTMSVKNGVSLWMALGFVLMNWLCFMVPVIGANILWGPCERAIAWKKFFADCGYQLITLILIALVTSFFM